MQPDAILDLYVWTVGNCFRCAEEGVSVTRLGAVSTPAGPRYELYACQRCVCAMELQRARRADRLRIPYLPGHLGGESQGEFREQGAAGEPQTPQ